MATLTREEQRKVSAKKHASYGHLCGICGKVAFGNGGWSSHIKIHKKELSALLGLNLMGERYSWVSRQFGEYAPNIACTGLVATNEPPSEGTPATSR